MMMKTVSRTRLSLKHTALIIALVVSSIPTPSHADAITSLISALMGQGLGGGNGQFVNGDPANQVIPLLQQIYRQNADNGGTNLSTERLQTQTDIQRSTYEQQTAWERERKLRDDEIARSYPEMSNLSCALATANKSVPAIEVAADNVIGQVVALLSSSMYRSLVLDSEISATKKAQIWCKLGATGKIGACDTEADPLIEGSDRGRHAAITRKVSIPCDMRSVTQDFSKMSNDNWTPSSRSNKECIAAILAIANEFPISTPLPTKEEANTLSGRKKWDLKVNQIAQAAATKGGVFEQFADRVSVAKSSQPNCDDGLKGGSESVYSLLEKIYQNYSRSTEVAPFGLPPNDFCLSKRLIRQGKRLLMDRYAQNERGKDNMAAKLDALLDVSIENYGTSNQVAIFTSDAPVANTYGPMDSSLADRSVKGAENNHSDDLLSAIRQLTSAIQTMNSGVYSDKAQEVRLKKAAPAISGKSAEITDALKEMGLKVSSPMPPRNGVLGPLTQEFPVLPPR